MEMIFVGIQKENVDSIEFFMKLEDIGLDYNVNISTGEITLSNVKPGMRNELVREISRVFEIEQITTRTSSERADVNLTQLEQALKKFKQAVYNMRREESAMESCVHHLIADLVLYNRNVQYAPSEGEIVKCNMGYGLPTENHGLISVVVLRQTEKDKYLVVPIDMKNQYPDERFCLKVIRDIDVVYYNNNNRGETATICLNRIQEVSGKRLYGDSHGIGKVTKRLLKKVYERLYLLGGEEISLNGIIEDIVDVALLVKCDENKETIDMFLTKLKIGEEYTLLRKAFYIAFIDDVSALKDIAPILKEQCELASENQAKQELRLQFVTWFKTVYPDVFEKYPKVSLGNILKAFLKQMNSK